MEEPVIRSATASDLLAGTALLGEALGFGAADRIPAWFAKDAQEGGAVALAAISGGDVVGFSFAMPALRPPGEPELFSCGLAVARAHRGRGIGRTLKLEQRRRALELGIGTIRWRADPLNVPALRLYLDGLGAQLVGYRTAIYAGIRDDGPVPHDDAEIEWRLDAPGGTPMTASRLVELPWEAVSLTGDRERCRWRCAVREAMLDALASGSVGIGVDREPGSGRAWLRFEAAR
jgi:GNAT superfamily N-acetyltransferase